MENLLIYHGISKQGMRFTITGKLLEQPENSSPLLEMGIALCSVPNFNKKVGRVISKGRLFGRSHSYMNVELSPRIVRKKGPINAFVRQCNKFERLSHEKLFKKFNVKEYGSK